MKKNTLLKEFRHYVALNICGMIGLSCYILADTFFISKGLGANGLTALNLAIPIYSFVHGSGLMLGMGGATKYSIYMGQGKQKEADRVYSNTIYIMAVFAVIFMITGISFSGKLALALGADQEVFSMTKTYLQVILLFAPVFIANDSLLCFVRNDGNPKLSMTAMIAGSLSNIVLDYVFIFSLYMGIFGAALATGLAPAISLGILSGHWLTKKNQLHFAKMKISLKQTGNIISLGIPALLTEVSSGIVMIIFNLLFLKLQGNIGVAAYGVIANLSLVATSVYTGIAQGIQPILSRFYGYGDAKSIRRILQYAVKLLLFISAGIYLLIFITANSVIGFFNSEQNMQLQQIAEDGLKLYFTALPFIGFNIVLSTYFTSTGKALPAQIVSLSRGFIIIIPMAYIMAFLFRVTGVWLSYPFTESMVALAGMMLYKNLVGGKRNV